jgi:hypothetical protein
MSEANKSILREPRPLSSEYHTARNRLMLWSGILFVWELVGIDIEQAKVSEGNAGVLARVMKSPQAIPWILLALIGYCLFRYTIEWYQSNQERRKRRVAKADFVASWCIALLAYALYAGQTISRMQFADLPGKSQLGSVVLGTVSSLIASIIVLMVTMMAKRFKIQDSGKHPIPPSDKSDPPSLPKN